MVKQKAEEQAEKINDMIGVMETAIKLDDSYVQKEIELFSRLTTENQVGHFEECKRPVTYCYMLFLFAVGIKRAFGHSKS